MLLGSLFHASVREGWLLPGFWIAPRVSEQLPGLWSKKTEMYQNFCEKSFKNGILKPILKKDLCNTFFNVFFVKTTDQHYLFYELSHIFVSYQYPFNIIIIHLIINGIYYQFVILCCSCKVLRTCLLIVSEPSLQKQDRK